LWESGVVIKSVAMIKVLPFCPYRFVRMLFVKHARPGLFNCSIIHIEARAKLTTRC
jgi:hypothetical protein